MIQRLLHRTRTAVKRSIARLGLDVRRRHDWDNVALAAVPDQLRKIHYGCGTLVFPGWLNVDLHPPAARPGAPTLRVNLVRPHPFPDGWFEYGFSEDFLEHLDQPDQIIFLTEAFRTLASRGVLRICFPDLDSVLSSLYVPPTCRTAIEAKAFCYDQHAHRCFMSRADMELVARHIGFTDLRFVPAGQSDHPVLAGLEHRVEQTGSHVVVELVK